MTGSASKCVANRFGGLSCVRHLRELMVAQRSPWAGTVCNARQRQRRLRQPMAPRLIAERQQIASVLQWLCARDGRRFGQGPSMSRTSRAMLSPRKARSDVAVDEIRDRRAGPRSRASDHPRIRRCRWFRRADTLIALGADPKSCGCRRDQWGRPPHSARAGRAHQLCPRPIVARLGSWRLPRPVAVPLVLTLVIAGIGGIAYALPGSRRLLTRLPAAFLTVAQAIEGDVRNARDRCEGSKLRANGEGGKQREEPGVGWPGWSDRCSHRGTHFQMV